MRVAGLDNLKQLDKRFSLTGVELLSQKLQFEQFADFRR